jgi:hypothetical protein
MAESTAVGKVSSLAEVEAAQIDQQIATARRYPRDPVAAIDKAKELAIYNAKTAQSCIYFRPIGRDKSGIQTFAEGPSIRLAEVLMSSWGNLRLGTRVVGEKDGNIHVQAMCHDLESNVSEVNEVARSVTGKSGRYSDSMIQVVIAAASRIAFRNVVFSVIPKVYAEQIMDACRAKIVGNPAQRKDLMASLVEAFKEMGVDKKKLMSAIDRKDYPAGSDSELVFLVGLHNAIKDGLCDVQDVFGKKSSKPEIEEPTERPLAQAAGAQQQAGQGQASGGAAVQPEGSGEGGPQGGSDDVSDIMVFQAVLLRLRKALGVSITAMNAEIKRAMGFEAYSAVPVERRPELIAHLEKMVKDTEGQQ